MPHCIDWPVFSRRRTSSARNRLVAAMMITTLQYPELKRSISLCFVPDRSRDKLPDYSCKNA